MLQVTADNLPRLMACIGSHRMGVNPTPSDVINTVREEGIALDYLIAQIVSGKFTSVELIDRKSPNDVLITEFMAECADEYVDKIMSEGGNPEFEAECINSGASYVVNGRADTRQIQPDGTLIITDAKFGWSIVDVRDNWTLISHAVATAKQTGVLPNRVVFRIYQPRPPHIDGTWRTWEITGQELLALAVRIEDRLSNPTDELQTGTQCDHCPSATQCSANMAMACNAIDVAGIVFDNTLTPEQLGRHLSTVKRSLKALEKHLDAYQDHAISVIRSDKVVPGWNTMRKEGRETFPASVTVEMVQALAPDVVVSKTSLKTPKQLKKAGVNPIVVDSLKTSFDKTVLVEVSAHSVASKSFGKLEK